MNFQNRTLRWASLPDRIRGMFNLNDPRWGRGDDKAEEGGRPEDRQPLPPVAGPKSSDQRPTNGQQPPDLDELWRDLNRKLGGFLAVEMAGDADLMAEDQAVGFSLI